jgi:hypothetical protein
VHRPLGEEGQYGGADVAATGSPAAAATAPVAAAELGATVEAWVPGDSGVDVSMSAVHL